MTRARTSRLVPAAYGGALLTLAWVGLGVLHLATGRDLGAGFQPSYLFLALVVLLELWRRSPARVGGDLLAVRPWSQLGLLALLAVGLSAAGLVWRPAEFPAAERWWRYGKQVIQLGIMFCFVVIPAAWTRGEHRWRCTLDLLAAGVGLQVVYGALQAVHFYHPLPWFRELDGWFTSNPAILAGSQELYLGEAFTGIPRLRGTACEPLYLGSYLLAVLPLLLLPERRRWHLATFGAGLLLLLATWARGAWLAGGVAAAVGLILARRAGLRARPRPALALGLLGALVLLILAILLLGGGEALLLPLRRLGQSLNLRDWSNLTRYYSMQAGWRAFLLSPLWGVGWGQFAFHFPALVDPLGLQSQFAWPVVNNYPLQILCETGLIGLGVFLAAAALLVRAVWRAVGAQPAGGWPRGEGRRWRVSLAAVSVAGVWSQLLTFSQFNLPHIWVAVGLLLAALQETDAPGGAPGA